MAPLSDDDAASVRAPQHQSYSSRVVEEPDPRTDISLTEIDGKRRDTTDLASHDSEAGTFPHTSSDPPISVQQTPNNVSVVQSCFRIVVSWYVLILLRRCWMCPSLKQYRDGCRAAYNLQRFPKTLSSACRKSLVGGYAQNATSIERAASYHQDPIYTLDHSAFDDISTKVKSDTSTFLTYIFFGHDFDPPWYVLVVSRILLPALVLSEFSPILLFWKRGPSTSSLTTNLLTLLIVYNVVAQIKGIDRSVSDAITASVSWCSSFDSDTATEHCLIDQWAFPDRLLRESVYVTFIATSRYRQRNRNQSLFSISNITVIAFRVVLVYIISPVIFPTNSTTSYLLYMYLLTQFAQRLWHVMKVEGFYSRGIKVILMAVYFCVTRFLFGWTAAVAAFGATRHQNHGSLQNFVCTLEYLERAGKYYMAESTAWNDEISRAVSVAQEMNAAIPKTVTLSVSVSAIPDDPQQNGNHSSNSSMDVVIDHFHRAHEHRAHLNLSLPLWAGFVICLNDSGQLEHFEEFQREREAVNLTGVLQLKEEGADLRNASISVSILGKIPKSTTTAVPGEEDENEI